VAGPNPHMTRRIPATWRGWIRRQLRKSPATQCGEVGPNLSTKEVDSRQRQAAVAEAFAVSGEDG
jgi:hypothetical protein